MDLFGISKACLDYGFASFLVITSQPSKAFPYRRRAMICCGACSWLTHTSWDAPGWDGLFHMDIWFLFFILEVWFLPGDTGGTSIQNQLWSGGNCSDAFMHFCTTLRAVPGEADGPQVMGSGGCIPEMDKRQLSTADAFLLHESIAFWSHFPLRLKDGAKNELIIYSTGW